METTQSVRFSKFRELMDIWDNYVLQENIEHEIDKFLQHKQILMFFHYPVEKKNKKDKTKPKLYGATEEGRLAFARLKNPNPDDVQDYQDSFSAYDLMSLISHTTDQDDVEKIKIFNEKDLSKIKIIDKTEAVEILAKHKSEKVIGPINEPDKKTILTDDE